MAAVSLPNGKIMPPDLPWTSGLGAASTPDIAHLNVEVDNDGNVWYGDAPAPEAEQKPRATHFDDNLAEGASNLSGLANDLIEGIEADDRSRDGWIENYNAGMDLLATKLKDSASSADMGGGKSISSVRHPLLLWACVKGQAMARAELLPAAGPVKVEVIGPADEGKDQRAEALEDDLNAYLTTGAPEYYPDMDRGLFLLYYGGVIFKKIYRCPWRERPVSEVVSVPDLIVSQEATDLDNAVRVTHRLTVTPGLFRKFQDDGVYLDIPVGEPSPATTTTDAKEAAVSGIAATSERPKDKSHTIYECYTDIDLSPHGVKQPKKGPLPYRITIEKDARAILEIRRNWKEGDKTYRRRKRFVKYGLIPGFGFLDYGWLHLLGNHTRALTALWRLVIDSGMMANFPGGLRLKGARSTTNEFAPGPGEFVPVDGGVADDIRKLIMPMPYKEPSAVMLEMIQQLATDGQQIAGAADIEVGEGRTNVPVGTVMAMIEQQTQIMAACHKRMHASQQEEFLVLKELFQEDPESLTRGNRNPARQWQTGQELDDLDLIPASDPNIPGQIHRIQQNAALMQLAQAAPQMFDLTAIAKRMLRGIGISDGDSLLSQAALSGQAQMTPPGAQPQPGAPAVDPQVMLAEKQIDSRDKAAALAAKQQSDAAKAAMEQEKLKTDSEQQILDRQSKENIAQLNAQVKREEIAADIHKHQNELEQHAAEAPQPAPEPAE